jgi:hypothetical protein
MKKTKNMNNLVANLMEEFDRLRDEIKSGNPNPEMVKAAYAAASVAGKIIAGTALQLEYHRRLGKVPILDTMSTPEIKQIAA